LINIQDRSTVSINSAAKIYLFSQLKGGKVSYQPVKLDTIKIGDRLSIVLNLSSDGGLEGQTVTIFPKVVTAKKS